MESIEVPVTGFRVDRVVTSGQGLENNCYVLGDALECLVVDASWDAGPLVEAVANRTVVGLVITHGHGDHCNAAADLVATTGAPVLVHPADAAAYTAVTGAEPDRELADGQVLTVGGVELTVLHTPGHTPGAVCLDAPALGLLLTGDTLFPGGPGKTGSPEEFAQFMASVERLLALPEDRRVLPGHGDATVIGDEKPHVEEWRARGW